MLSSLRLTFANECFNVTREANGIWFAQFDTNASRKKRKKNERTYKIKDFIFIHENHCYRNGQLLKKFSCLNEFESMFRESIDDSAKNFIFYFILGIFFALGDTADRLMLIALQNNRYTS